MRAIVTGGASGIGAAIVARLRAEQVDVEVLDLTHGFDVTEPDHWDEVGPIEIASLNAGVLGGAADPAELSLDATGGRCASTSTASCSGCADSRG